MMLNDYRPVIADTSCLILLNRIKELNLLQKLFGELYITQKVADEYRQTIPDYIKIANPKNKKLVARLADKVDMGEATSIALAKEWKNSILIIDDLKGRKIAGEMNITFTGTIGIILLAKENNIISSLTPIFTKIKKTDFRVPQSLLDTLSKKLK